MPSIDEAIEYIPSLSVQHVFRAGGGENDELDYSVLSVAVCTLGLILCVELVRHSLDHTANGKPFFKTVLEGVYGELSTLGVVEFFIFLLHKYYKDLNVAQELVFADVHFTLFFTAIFNAFGSVFMAFFVKRVSNRLWVQTEYQNLYHYVEIREEFDRVERKLLKHTAAREKADIPDEYGDGFQPGRSERFVRAAPRKSLTRQLSLRRLWGDDMTNESLCQVQFDQIRQFFKASYRFIRAPVLYRKHHNLLIQVRFHELKYQFLEANDLPVTLRISDYLKRSELHVLQSLVHISTFAWLLLTGGLNVMYFLMGMVVEISGGNNFAVGRSLSFFFFVYMAVVVLLSFGISSKMHWIFRRIIQARLIATNHMQGNKKDDIQSLNQSIRSINSSMHSSMHSMQSLDTLEGGFNQKGLFWGGSPHFIIIMVQFMQFGFAVALSILLIFWDDINTAHAEVSGEYYLFAIFVCYIIFLYSMAHVIPQFTLCSNLGQLINLERLQETLARHRLEQVQREREQLKAEREASNSFHLDEADDAENVPVPAPPRLSAIQSIGAAVVDLATKSEHKRAKQKAAKTEISAETLAQLVRVETRELRNQLPPKGRPERGSRRRSLSDGIEAMKNYSSFVSTENAQPNSLSGKAVAAQADNQDKSDCGTEVKRASDRILLPNESFVKKIDVRGDGQYPGTQTRRAQRRNSAGHIGTNAQTRFAELTACGQPREQQDSTEGGPTELVRNISKTQPEPQTSSHSFQPPSRSQFELNRCSAKWHHDSLTAREDSEILRKPPERGQPPSSPTSHTEPKHKDLMPSSSVTKLFGKKSQGVDLLEESTASFFSSAQSHPSSAEQKPAHRSALFGSPIQRNTNLIDGSYTSIVDNSKQQQDTQDRQMSPLRPRHVSRSCSSSGRHTSSRDENQSSQRDNPFQQETPTQEDLNDGSATSLDPADLFCTPTDEFSNGGSRRPFGKIGGDTAKYFDNNNSDLRSDEDDIPDISELDRRRKKEEQKPTLYELIRKHFRGRRYMVTSALFGTMVAFFLVGMRVEALLLGTGAIKDNHNTWQFQPVSSFWAEFSLLVCFLTVDVMILIMFRPNTFENNGDRCAFASAVIDSLINATCLTCLILAEVQRCCEDEEDEGLYRFLAGSDGGYGGSDGGYDSDYDKIEIECCPTFGFRLYGGVGTIEPFTSLVALRILRFGLGERVVKWLDKIYGWSEYQMTSELHESIRNPMDPMYIANTKRKVDGGPHADNQGHDHDHGDHRRKLTREVGTIVELWQMALRTYPDIVENHGEFSGELLQAMLGIEVVEDSRNNVVGRQCDGNEEKSHLQMIGTIGDVIPVNLRMYHASPDIERPPHAKMKLKSHQEPPQVQPTQCSPLDTTGRSFMISKKLGKQYQGLSPEAQSIILAGKVGKTIRTKENGSKQDDSARNVPSYSSIPEPGLDESQTEGVKRPPPNGIPEFLIVDDLDFGNDFFAPNARLQRSMRRCDRKMLPHLDKWMVVDVVMTKFEIVYFDATEVDRIDEDTSLDPKTKRMQDVKAAISATNGGKGLRLRDVAYGRKVVGRLEFSSIETIQVDRVLPHTISDTEMHPYGFHIYTEYWKNTTKPIQPTSRQARWAQVKEDRLKLATKHGTLYLRFYSDLDYCELNADRMLNENEIEGPLFKNNALQWCQTVGRLVGTSRLHQSLANFGSANECDELRDFLVVVEQSGATHNGAKGLFSSISGFRNSMVFSTQVSGRFLAGSLKRTESLSHERIDGINSRHYTKYGESGLPSGQGHRVTSVNSSQHIPEYGSLTLEIDPIVGGRKGKDVLGTQSDNTFEEEHNVC